MTPGREDEVRLDERAAQWFGVLQEEESAREPFFAWLAESPRHVQAFLSMLALVQEIAELSPEARARLERLSGEMQALDRVRANVVALDTPAAEQIQTATTAATSAQQRPKRWRVGASLAASVLLAGALGWGLSGKERQVYATAVGEQRVIELADGSIVYLNTDSRLEVRFTDRGRSLRLDQGQALFKVERDATRPFVVRSGDTAIRAIGTQFDVYRRAAQTRVAVIQGAVQISDSRHATKVPGKLAAGEAVEVAANGELTRRGPLDAAKVNSWRQRRLVFRQDTLGDIAAEFNRYNTSVRIKVIGEIANAEHFSGTFEADEPETLVQALAGDETLRVERVGKEILIRKRP